jgi:hypothetical protein
MAASASAALRNRDRIGKLPKNVKEPVSFHLAFLLGNDYVLPDGKSSVDVLRMPFHAEVSDEESPNPSETQYRFFRIDGHLFSKTSNLTATKMEFWTKKFTTTQAASDNFENAWQDRLVIITEKRIFIVTAKRLKHEGESGSKGWLHTADSQSFDTSYLSDNQTGLEIVDSIPMEEVVSVTLEGGQGVWENEKRRAHRNPVVRCFSRTVALLSDPRFCPASAAPADEDGRQPELHASPQELRRTFSSAAEGEDEAHCEPMLRITTKRSGFNRGQEYYFLLRKQDHPSVDAEGGTAALRSRADVEGLAETLAELAARRRGEHVSETRFLRLQGRLRRTWDSIPFNLAVLALIVSNFVFTVAQVPPPVPRWIAAHAQRLNPKPTDSA